MIVKWPVWCRKSFVFLGLNTRVVLKDSNTSVDNGFLDQKPWYPFFCCLALVVGSLFILLRLLDGSFKSSQGRLGPNSKPQLGSEVQQ